LGVGAGASVEDEDVDENEGKDEEFVGKGPVAGVGWVGGAGLVHEDVLVGQIWGIT
jgi:hypothetical protein